MSWAQWMLGWFWYGLRNLWAVLLLLCEAVFTQGGTVWGWLGKLLCSLLGGWCAPFFKFLRAAKWVGRGIIAVIFLLVLQTVYHLVIRPLCVALYWSVSLAIGVYK